jgi:xanthine/uracil permease
MVSNAEVGPNSVSSAVIAAPAEKTVAKPVVLDVGFDQVMPWPKHIALSVQNMLVLAGLFLFPGLFGAAYHLSSGDTARLYGAAFVAVGFGTVLQGVLKLRMPIVLGPWSATLAGLLVLGKIYGLGTAFGSLTVAAAIVTVLAIPIRGVSLIRSVAGLFNAPTLSGGIVLITGIGLEQIAVVNWAGKPGSVGFGSGNWTGGLVALVVVTVLFAFTRGFMRALAMILGIIIGSFIFAAFAPISFTAVAHGPWLAVPSAFQFGFGVNATCLIIFLVLLLPPFISALGFYSMVGEWGGQQVSSQRMAWGVFGIALSSVLAGIIGTFSTSVYPENVGLLRSSRVGSRWVTVTAGAGFIVVGFIYKIGAIFAAIPSGIIGASAVAMFAVIMVSGVEILAKEDWSPRKMMVVGLPTVLSVGGVFLAPDVYAHYPLLVRELITQPLVTGPFLLVILFLLNKAVPARFGLSR